MILVTRSSSSIYVCDTSYRDHGNGLALQGPRDGSSQCIFNDMVQFHPNIVVSGDMYAGKYRIELSASIAYDGGKDDEFVNSTPFIIR